MKTGAQNYRLSQMTAAERQATLQPRNPETGRFLRVDGDTRVEDVASFQHGARDLVGALGNLKVSDLQQLFGGRSVTQIRKMGVAARAAVLAPTLGQTQNPSVSAAQLGASLGFSPVVGVQVGGNPPAVYDDPGIGAFLTEARGHLDAGAKALFGGEAQNTARATAQATELAEVILDEHPSNPDARLVRGEATKLAALASVDRRAPANESNNVRRQAISDLKASLGDFRAVVNEAAQAGVYDPATNQVTLTNVNKFVGNDQVRNLISAATDALAQIASTQMALAKLEGTEVFSEGNLAALKTAATVGTDLVGDKAQALVSESSYSGKDAWSQAHNAKVKASVASVAEFGAQVGQQNAQRLSAAPELRGIASQQAFQNAIR